MRNKIEERIKIKLIIREKYLSFFMCGFRAFLSDRQTCLSYDI